MLLKVFDTLIEIFIVLMIIRFFVRFLFPLLLGTYVRRKMSDMQQNQQGAKRREGEVTIDSKPGNKKKFSKDTGEYVDYEEVK